MKKWRCSVCGYVHEGERPPELCPVCGSASSEFKSLDDPADAGEAVWKKIGKVADLKQKEIQQIEVGGERIALSYQEGRFGAISGKCLHVGGPLGEGCIHEGYVVCPWHGWRFHRISGEATPGIPAAVPRYEIKQEGEDLYINLNRSTEAKYAPHPEHPLSRPYKREPGPIRVLGLSTTLMSKNEPRFSTSEALLQDGLEYASKKIKCETRLIKLREIQFKPCEGYYSKSASACTWPCSVTQMDPSDELSFIYEALIFWADIVLVSTPIRWGNASSLYYKMVERMNCIQNQVTIPNRILICNKVASFIITGGQDNVQSVAGQMMMFFGELGFHFPPFPFVGHSRGWEAEDMENNVHMVKESAELKRNVHDLVERCVDLAKLVVHRKM